MKFTRIRKRVTEAVEELGTQRYPKNYPTYKKPIDPMPQEVMPTSFVSSVRDTNKNIDRANKAIEDRRKIALDATESSYEDRFKHMSNKERRFNSGEKISLDESLFVEANSNDEQEDGDDEINDLSEYKPWGGAKDNYNNIIENGKLEIFVLFINEVFPEGLTKTEINELLWRDFDFIKEEIKKEEEQQTW